MSEHVPAPLGPAAAQAPRAARLRRCRRRGFLHALGGAALLLAVAFGFVVRFAARGLPAEWVDELSRRFSTDLYSVELSGVSFSLSAMELRVAEARVYPRGVVSGPLVRAAGGRIHLRPRRSKPAVEWIDSVRLRSLAVAMPDGGLSLSGGDSEEPLAVADFPPVAFACASSDIMGLRTHFTSCTLSCRGGILHADAARTDLHAPREARQRMEGSFECDPARLAFRSTGSGRIDPAKLDPLLRAVGAPSVADEIAKFSFAGAPPEADAVYEYDPGAGVRSLSIAIRADAGGVYNGVRFSSAGARLRVSGPSGWTRLDVEGLRVARPEGETRGSLAIDLDGETLRFDAVSTMDPKRTLAMLGVLSDPGEIPLEFDNPTETRASGVYAIGGGQERTAIDLRMASPGVSAPDLPGLRFDRARAEGVFTNGVLDLASVRADALGGDIAGTFRLALPGAGREEADLAAAAALRGVSHAAWTALFREPVEGDTGRADADLSLEGPLADIASLRPVRTRGTLRLDVHDVPAFRIVFFSGLRDFLSRKLASFDPLADDFLHVRARMDAGVVAIDALRIEGGAISVTGSGNVWTDGVVNLGVKVHLMNRRSWVGAGLYYLFSPISSIFAVRATGRADNPSWESEALFLSGTDVKPDVAPEPPPLHPATP
ncbi:MAG: hypothetical protein IJV65_07875 [Kiritimatiellae bacterium]|nr:hypothetical protein [Kiritimatiellia bacterium]